MWRHGRLIGAMALLVAALAFLGHRVYETRRDIGRARYALVDPVVLQARELYASGNRAEALSLLSVARREQPANADVALEYATVLYTTQNYAAAEAAASELLQRRPDFARALCLRGIIRRDSGKLDEGVADLEAALAAQPNEVLFLYSLAHTLLLRSARELEPTPTAQADMDRGQQLLERAAQMAPAPDILSDLALLQKRRGQWPKAIETYQRLAEILPEEAGPLAEAADCYLSSADPKKAAEAARAAIERDPEYAPGHEHLARALRKMPAESVDAAEYKRALRSWWDRSNADSSTPALWLAEVHVQEGDLEAAEAVLREAVGDEEARRRVPDPEVHAQLARVLQDSGRTEQAEAELAQARRLHQQWDPVGDLMNRILARPGDSREERLAVARLYQELGWPQKGLHYLRPLVNADPPDAEAQKLAEELEETRP